MSLLCRFCEAPLAHHFADLGQSPLSNRFLRADQLAEMEPFYPLTAYVCERCLLVQLPPVETPERLFTDYPYFSSYSDTWLAHARRYCETMMARFPLGADTPVIEIASNDGYLLQYFRNAGVPVLGVEPAANVAEVARRKGIDTIVRFFGAETARELVTQGRSARLLLGNNVLAHVPHLSDFVEGLRILLQPQGVITMEFPHLLRLMESNQFDTIYHEHFSYFSLLAATRVLAAHGLTVVDVDELPTHGGSLRIYAMHAAEAHEPAAAVGRVVALERAYGLEHMDTYAAFSEQVRAAKRAFLSFLIAAKNAGQSMAAYGAPAKGNTLLNYCGIRTDFIDYTVDRSPHKQGLFLPGTHIPIHAPERLRETRPDFVIILPWNLQEEIVQQMPEVRGWGGRFVVPIPRVRILE
jgi:hypothetical protein